MGRKHFPETKARISRGLRWRNGLKRICPGDLADLGGCERSKVLGTEDFISDSQTGQVSESAAKSLHHR